MNARRLIQATARRKSGEDHPATNQPQSDWARIPTAQAISGVGRSTLYANFDISGGAIKTASIRRRGATRGIRMVSVPSLLAWLNSYAEYDHSVSSENGTGAGSEPASQATTSNPNNSKS